MVVGGVKTLVPPSMLPTPRHRLPQRPVDGGLVAAALGFEPRHYIGIDAQGDLLLDGTVELPNLCALPLLGCGRRDVGVVNFRVGQVLEGFQLCALLLNGLAAHKSSVPTCRPCEPR